MGGISLPSIAPRSPTAYAVAAEALGRHPTAVEKDVWVCRTLNALFTTPNRPSLAFKGGTSLSKCHDAIKRFSEDVDVTMQLTDDDFSSMSRNVRARRFKEIAAEMAQRVETTFLPHMQREAATFGAEVSIEGDGEELHVAYPTAVNERAPYYREVVKVEFGARAGTVPSTSRTLMPDVAEIFPHLEFPTATVDVLNAERTFWEKFTLAHAESGRSVFKNAERFSRHWYDLAVLADHEVGASAIADLGLLDQVVVMKDLKVGGVDYNDCATGHAALVPTEAGLTLLRSDYEAMVA